jgi:diguanylate cyclase (GGDEF)-like protein
MSVLARARLALVIAPVCAAGGGLVAVAARTVLGTHLSAVDLAAIATLLGASMLADRFPVPIQNIDASGISLGFVFSVAAVLLLGWAPAVVIVFASATIVQLLDKRPPERAIANASVHALAAGAGGLAVAPITGGTAASLALATAACSVAQYVTNVALTSAIVAAASRRRFASVSRRTCESTALPFALMGSAALMLVVLWQRSPALSLALLGPLLAIGLYQRSHLRELSAVRLAFTDPLTGLGNHRQFHDRLRHELESARRRRSPLTLCLVDLDDFKQINDRFGHPAGDTVLARVASELRQNGEAFRLGGDEFAVLFDGFGPHAALSAAESIVRRVAALRLGRADHVTASAGLATCPVDAGRRDELVRLADDALYTAKEHGKNQARRHTDKPRLAGAA